MKTKNCEWLTLHCACSCIVAFGLTMGCDHRSKSLGSIQKFSPAEWQQSIELRLGMTQDLSEQLVRKKPDTAQIATLLGNPDRILSHSEVRGPKADDHQFLFYRVSHPDSFDTAFFIIVTDTMGIFHRSYLFVN